MDIANNNSSISINKEGAMTLEKRITEIKDQLLWMADKPKVSILARYNDPYYKSHTHFAAKQYDEFEKKIEQYAKEHPVT